jgi:ATP-dependent Clp protease ATP-binding subunit ClpA
MFERFTDRARRSVVLAQEEARELGHPHIGTEHLLLGLVSEGSGVAAKALAALAISRDAIRRQVEEITGRGDLAASGHIPFTKGAKHALELALREAIHLGHNYIGTEHILLALLRDADSVAAQALAAQGAELATVRQQVIRLLHDYQSKEPVGRARHLTDISRGIETIMERLARIERRLSIGAGPQPEALRHYNLRIAQVRRAKESAIDAMNFAQAAELRTEEKHLLRQRDVEEGRWLTEPRDRLPTPGSDDPAALRAEISWLRGLLIEHGIDPGDPPLRLAKSSSAEPGGDDLTASAGTRTEPGGPSRDAGDGDPAGEALGGD